MHANFIIYAAIAPLDVLCGPISTLMRVSNKVWIQNIGALLNNVILGNTVLALGFWVFDWGIYSVMISFCVSIACMNGLYLTILFGCQDWGKIKKLDADNAQKEENRDVTVLKLTEIQENSMGLDSGEVGQRSDGLDDKLLKDGQSG